MAMVIRRLLIFPVLLLVISFFTFLLTNFVPGDIAEDMILRNGGQPTPELITDVQVELGLDQPLLVRYGHWLIQTLKFDLGTSWITEQPVIEEITQRIAPTLILTGTSVVIGIFITFILGMLAAYYKDSFIDRAILGFSLTMNCIPDFLLSFVLLFLFGYVWSVFPLVGYGTWQHVVLPSIVLGVGLGAGKARILRASLLEELSLDYIKMARAKGLSRRTVMFKHALRNALIPVVTQLGASVGFLLGGTVIIESIFNWPGLGRLGLQAIVSRDIPLLQGYVLLITIIIISINLVVDLIYLYIDPRMNSKGGTTHV
ncbi:ABC-type dipeptide/oligopeptide/nickel transport system, permease component [Schinkia azotoformans MEV2011]|uniref:ABC-type dipeptide/oligopeptide/nickel transport system, permease component n=1 Tax=Schinkia azotoformans MEV2011 TaxID=1348973 RepID=A0A072NFB4_SCHAZ|nr:ABC transporter permease [Schinkia azotoformans]KEF36226.1 ABC-type dipeptide/oligopeptide/nickel transport system, permease component [Schinkia azotoformans MEV2011]MEC1693900.1 ABC transporter permease [Schinkia azotoformans]MEC1724755.1 ABC transporter permease [Schinkia azotoformans]MEC1770009.1 ABC transporter permease [Schinkia azotoformans]MEC1780538.1 ABC transporter permease [Schinkia azotoformans]